MGSQSIARILLTVFCAIQGAATIALDLNRTHAAHPQWLGHARFHVVWQTGIVTALAIVECALVWFPGPLEAGRFYFAALLATLPMLSFFAALLTRSLYGGRLSDPGGIPPLRLSLGGRKWLVDMNLVAELAGAITVLVIVALYRLGTGSP